MLFGWQMAAGDPGHSGGDLENQPAWLFVFFLRVFGFSLGVWLFPIAFLRATHSISGLASGLSPRGEKAGTGLKF